MKVDKAPPEEIGSEKENLTIEAHPHHLQIPNNFWEKLTIEAHGPMTLIGIQHDLSKVDPNRTFKDLQPALLSFYVQVTGMPALWNLSTAHLGGTPTAQMNRAAWIQA